MAQVCPEGQNNIKLKKLKTAAIFLREAGVAAILFGEYRRG